MTGKEFAEWMDNHGVDNAIAAKLFGTAEQTIYNWRSTRGVPSSKEEWVRKVMADYDHRRPPATLPQRLALEIPTEKYLEWDRAAHAAGKLLYHWAIDSLDEMAAAEQTGANASPGSRESPASNPLDAGLVSGGGSSSDTHKPVVA